MRDRLKHALPLLIALIAMAATTHAQVADTITTILPPEEFQTAIVADSDAIVMDVRKPGEFVEEHIEGALLLDWLDQTTWKNGMRCLSKQPTYYLYCRSGKRQHQAAIDMQRRGYKVVELQGGFNNWKSHDMPITREE